MTTVLLVETTKYAPVTPLFGDALSSIPGVTGEFLDEEAFVHQRPDSLIHSALYRLRGKRPLGSRSFNRALVQTAERLKPDVVLVVKGPFVEPASLRAIKERTGAYLVNYATDDPFNRRVSSGMMRAAIPSFDLYACTKRAIIDDVRSAGCGRAEFVPFAFDPKLHHPEPPTDDRFDCDVAFIGGADADRTPFFEHLVREMPDLRMNLFGGYWDRHAVLGKYARGFVEGSSFRQAVGAAKVNVNLVRRSNRDGHVMRSFELPACGGFTLMERTAEHLDMFEEGAHTWFFEDPDELASAVARSLEDEGERARMAEACRRHVTAGKNTYEDRLRQILDLVPAR